METERIRLKPVWKSVGFWVGGYGFVVPSSGGRTDLGGARKSRSPTYGGGSQSSGIFWRFQPTRFTASKHQVKGEPATSAVQSCAMYTQKSPPGWAGS